MCGIVGYIGKKPVVPILINGLKSLEYRGYDSAGISVVSPSGIIQVIKASGKIANLELKVNLNNSATIGIGHTRWATHGRPTEENAHPHCSSDGQVVAVHNGIFENFIELKTELKSLGYDFATDTDTECFPMMVSYFLKLGNDFRTAFIKTIARMKGIYAIACLSTGNFGHLLIARNGPPLIIGLGDGENFIASDVIPIACHTNKVIYLEDGDLADITNDEVVIFRIDGTIVNRPITIVNCDSFATNKGHYKHFMHKEIFEQPTVVSNTLSNKLPIDIEPVHIDLPFETSVVQQLKRIVILACGTSFNAGLVGKFYFEQLAKIGVEVECGSEYRYRDPVIDSDTLVIGITQSGETADTLAALKEAQKRGAYTFAICNVQNSTITRQVNNFFLTCAGPEIGVASTKAFTTQLVTLLLLALRFGELRNSLCYKRRADIIQSLRELPLTMERVIGLELAVHQWAKKCKAASNFIYLGRGPLYPIAIEGALKLKETSYIHAEGFPAGEMKHGPIALIDKDLPIVALMSNDIYKEKMLSNLQEVAARDGRIFAFVAENDNSLEDIAEEIIYMPNINPMLAPILYVLPLQLLAYNIAVLRGCDVDQPRNLAKSVTVE